MDNRFNLIDEPWIPVADYGKVSLADIFTNDYYQSLGGSPTQKIAIFKLLLAIAQAAATPKDEKQWQQLGAKGMAEKCLSYLNQWHDRFYLYGDKPFLQMPAVAKARALSLGAFIPEVSTGNTTVLIQSQIESRLSDGDKALLLLSQMSFALSGKKTDNSVVLTAGYTGKQNDKGRPSTGKPGPAVGHMGFLHNFVMAKTLLSSIYLNMLSLESINTIGMFKAGIGTAPWEIMPVGEACPTAQQLKQSYMGRLVALCRFCLLAEDSMHYSEGIAHDNYREGVHDLSVAVDYSGKDPKAKWTDSDKRPWRELPSLLSFISHSGGTGFQSWQIRIGVERARDNLNVFSIWSGGLRVSSNAGEQYVSGTDDAQESNVWLESKALGDIWFHQLQQEMESLDSLAKALYVRVNAYFKKFTVDGKSTAALATSTFWQFCERDFQDLVNSCDANETAHLQRKKLRQKFAWYQHQAYDLYCFNHTARQMDAWAENRPNHYTYLNQEAS